jgi:hypothetical protein
MFSLVQRFRESGQEALISKKYGNRNRARPDGEKERILGIVRSQYADFGPTLAHEKLVEDHGERFSVETLRKWMKADGLWTDRAGRKPRIHQSRKPRPRRGELVQVDGSYHRWFEKRGPECCLIVFIDDATSELMHLEFVDHESSYNYMNCLRRYLNRFGCPEALFSDRHSVFRVANATKDGDVNDTQFSRACKRIGIKVICAKTPQAKGRVKRANRTLQDRLIKEMRLRKISTMTEGNAYLPEYMAAHNKLFSRVPESEENAHKPLPNESIDSLLTYTDQRKVFKDLSVSFNKMRFILEDSDASRRAIGNRVTVAVSLEGDIDILFQEIPLSYTVFDKIRRVPQGPDIVDHKRLNAALDLAAGIADVEPHHFKRNNHMLAGFRKHFQNGLLPVWWTPR